MQRQERGPGDDFQVDLHMNGGAEGTVQKAPTQEPTERENATCSQVGEEQRRRTEHNRLRGQDAVRYNVIELRQVVELQTKQLNALESQISYMRDCNRTLREALLDARDQRLRYQDEIRELKAALALDPSSYSNIPGSIERPDDRRLIHQSGETRQYQPEARQLHYQTLIHQIRSTVQSVVPDSSTVVVVSKGDDELLKLSGQRAWHFPQNGDGVYAGYYPADSAVAIAHLEVLMDKGADFLLFPSTALWWLEHYKDFQHYLDTVHQLLCTDESCTIYQLIQLIHSKST